MEIVRTSLPDVMVIQPDVHGDDRGFLVETFHEQRYAQCLPASTKFVQANRSRSNAKVLRGLHLQDPYPQAKLVSVTDGEIWDVAVDLRHGSSTFGQWAAATLTASAANQIFVPEGFAHGYVVLSDGAEVSYLCSNYYRPDAEICISWNDPTIAIPWPIERPIVSDKDANGRSLREYEGGHE